MGILSLVLLPAQKNDVAQLVQEAQEVQEHTIHHEIHVGYLS